jgi:hypothetical protein
MWRAATEVKFQEETSFKGESESQPWNILGNSSKQVMKHGGKRTPPKPQERFGSNFARTEQSGV